MASKRIERLARRGDRNAVNQVVTEKINAVREALDRLEETLDCEGGTMCADAMSMLERARHLQLYVHRDFIDD